jgi:hypothetical protein
LSRESSVPGPNASHASSWMPKRTDDEASAAPGQEITSTTAAIVAKEKRIAQG